MKFDVAPPLNPLIEKAQDAFLRADIIVVVGFSFADADLYISRMLIKAIQKSETIKLLIFDPDISVGQKITSQLSNRIANFDERRVNAVIGDCSETLPKFLEGKLLAEDLKPRKKTLRPLPASLFPKPVSRFNSESLKAYIERVESKKKSNPKVS
jgi:hypothetical protein